MPTYTDRQIEQALEACEGMVYVAARRLGCSPNTIKKRLGQVQYLADLVEAKSGLVDDTAELKLWQAIQNGEAWAIQFRLRTVGKSRGYVERQEVTGAEGGPLVLHWPEADAT